MKKAFTLTELLIVIGIISIISAIAVSSLGNYLPTTRLRGDQNMLINDLREAQQQAVTSQKRHLIRFDNVNPADPKYYYLRLDGEDEIILSTQEFSEGILIDLSNVPDNEFSFGSDGSPAESGTIIIINDKGQTRDIEVTPAGQIK